MQGERSRLGCTGRRLADRKKAWESSNSRNRCQNVFGEGAEHDARGRVCSPFVLDCSEYSPGIARTREIGNPACEMISCMTSIQLC